MTVTGSYSAIGDKKIISPGILLPLAIAGIIIIIISTVFEYRYRQKDHYRLLENQAALIMNTLENTSRNAFAAASTLEQDISSRIRSNLQLIEQLYRKNGLHDMPGITAISQFSEIHIYNKDMHLIKSSNSSKSEPVRIDKDILSAALNNRSDDYFTIPARNSTDSDLMGIIEKTINGGYIAGIIAQDQINKFRRTFGFGRLLKSYSQSEGVEYIALESRETIIAGFLNDYPLSRFLNDPFLSEVLSGSSPKTRILTYQNRRIFEALMPFTYENEQYGLLRLGLSMQALDRLNEQAKRRILIFAGLLAVIGIVFVNFSLTYRHRQLLKKDIRALQNYTNAVLENMDSGIISLDSDRKIQIVNKKASEVLNRPQQALFKKHYSQLPAKFVKNIDDCFQGRMSSENPVQFQNAAGSGKWLAFRHSLLTDENNAALCILLIDDVTERIKLEEHVRRNEKLAAVKKLASAVAHEIRNPLNSIKLIVDLLRKQFTPDSRREQYVNYITTVNDEIGRVSRIVTEFLQYSRPQQYRPSDIGFLEFFSELEMLFSEKMRTGNIRFLMEIEPNKDYRGDPEQLKQVFVNLIENSFHAVSPGGEIRITGRNRNEHYELTVTDNGSGINETDPKRIFDLYYTTKKNGSGIGLAVVHQIITIHGGTIEVKSRPGAGTTFMILLPFSYTQNDTEQEK